MKILYIPEKLVEEAKRRGIDINEFILNTLATVLNLNSYQIASIRLEIAEKFLKEAEEYISERDVIQASEVLLTEGMLIFVCLFEYPQSASPSLGLGFHLP